MFMVTIQKSLFACFEFHYKPCNKGRQWRRNYEIVEPVMCTQRLSARKSTGSQMKTCKSIVAFLHPDVCFFWNSNFLCLSLFPSVCLSLSFCLSLSVSFSVSLSVCLSLSQTDTHIHTHTHAHAHTHTRMHARTYACTHTHTHSHSHTHTHTHTHTHSRTHRYVFYTSTQIFTHTRMNTCIQTYTYAYTHIYILVRSEFRNTHVGTRSLTSSEWSLFAWSGRQSSKHTFIRSWWI